MQQHPPQGLLQDLLTPTWTTFPNSDSGLFPLTTFCHEDDESLLASSLSSSSFLQLISSSIQPTFQCESIFPITLPSPDSFTPLDGSNASLYEQHVHEYEYDDKHTSRVSIQQGFTTMAEEQELDEMIHEEVQVGGSENLIPDAFSLGEKKSKSKKVQGQPSKNLMAERRRRKRLNDRLSMLRSVVPRISKMDRTSILSDTIDYMKDLLEKIHNLKEQDIEMNSFSELKINEVQTRSPPKFEVERRNIDTRIQICCSPKPGLLLSTMNTLEALGLDIQQCVLSSFGDFSMHASCLEVQENRATISSEEIKQILFRNAGYGGRCL